MNRLCRTLLPPENEHLFFYKHIPRTIAEQKNVSQHSTQVFQSRKTHLLLWEKNQVNINWSSFIFHISLDWSFSIHWSLMSSSIVRRFFLLVFLINIFFKHNQCMFIVDQMNTDSLNFSQIFHTFSSFKNKSQLIGEFATFWCFFPEKTSTHYSSSKIFQGFQHNSS
jgi:hypothetical protein